MTLIFFSIDKDTELNEEGLHTFWIKRCPELIGLFWFLWSVRLKVLDLQRRRSEEGDMLWRTEQPFGRGRNEFFNLEKVCKHDQTSERMIQASDDRNKLFVIAVAWSFLCFDWYASCYAEESRPCDPADEMRLTTTFDLKSDKEEQSYIAPPFPTDEQSVTRKLQ